jgi:hypothetical protein
VRFAHVHVRKPTGFLAWRRRLRAEPPKAETSGSGAEWVGGSLPEAFDTTSAGPKTARVSSFVRSSVRSSLCDPRKTKRSEEKRGRDDRMKGTDRCKKNEKVPEPVDGAEKPTISASETRNVSE